MVTVTVQGVGHVAASPAAEKDLHTEKHTDFKIKYIQKPTDLSQGPSIQLFYCPALAIHEYQMKKGHQLLGQ